MGQPITYVDLNVHEDTVAVAVAETGRRRAVSDGRLGGVARRLIGLFSLTSPVYGIWS